MMKTAKYKRNFNGFVYFCHRRRKEFSFLNKGRSWSKTHAQFFWHIYDSYNYGKIIGKTCVYKELMSLEDTPLKAIISIYRPDHGSPMCSIILSLKSLESVFLYRALSEISTKIFGKIKSRLNVQKIPIYRHISAIIYDFQSFLEIIVFSKFFTQKPV